MWFRKLFESLKRRSCRATTKPRSATRLTVESLEDRCVPATLSVGDVTLLEGNVGTQYALVTVSLDAPSTKIVRVNYNTADGTAMAGSDYEAVSGKLTFAPGETSQTIQVGVIGDSAAESDEHYFVNLHGAKGAKIADGRGIIAIVDDDPSLPPITIVDEDPSVPPIPIADDEANLPTISISDAEVWGGDPVSTFMTFTVTLSAASDETVTVNFATQDYSGFYYIPADAGHDYLATSGTLTFAPGETTKAITVTILGSYNPEYNELFVVNLSGASANALIVDGEGIGWIVDEWSNFEGGDPYNTY